MVELIGVVAVLAVLFGIVAYYGQRPPTVAELLERMAFEIDQTKAAIGERLRPALEDVVVAMREFGEAFRG